MRSRLKFDGCFDDVRDVVGTRREARSYSGGLDTPIFGTRRSRTAIAAIAKVVRVRKATRPNRRGSLPDPRLSAADLNVRWIGCRWRGGSEVIAALRLDLDRASEVVGAPYVLDVAISVKGVAVWDDFDASAFRAATGRRVRRGLLAPTAADPSLVGTCSTYCSTAETGGPCSARDTPWTHEESHPGARDEEARLADDGIGHLSEAPETTSVQPCSVPPQRGRAADGRRCRSASRLPSSGSPTTTAATTSPGGTPSRSRSGGESPCSSLSG